MPITEERFQELAALVRRTAPLETHASNVIDRAWNFTVAELHGLLDIVDCAPGGDKTVVADDVLAELQRKAALHDEMMQAGPADAPVEAPLIETAITMLRAMTPADRQKVYDELLGMEKEAPPSHTDSAPQSGAESQAPAVTETLPPATGSDPAQTDAPPAAVEAGVSEGEAGQTSA